MDLFNDDDPFGANIYNDIAQGFAGAFGGQMQRPRRPYDEYMKAYSMAMLPGRERTNVSYGGKIMMPPSALQSLTSLDLENPWMFRLSNPQNPAAVSHGGVLEFIAEEGCVHLPYWMMKALRIDEGDPIHITSVELPKGKFVKLQAQSVHFLEISDPKAVLEHALRNFSALTQGDIIEISYNSIVFNFLIMETQPGGAGINVVDTDLEVDFATPVGYKEPERPKPAPPSTMASKLKIDLNSATPGSSRPSSSLSGAFAIPETVVSKDGERWESFKGKGETLGGRKTKGRGISQKGVEDMMEGSRAYRTGQRRIVTNALLETDANAPASLNLPHGKLFFGFKYVPYKGGSSAKKQGGGGAGNADGTDVADVSSETVFGGAGVTLSGRTVGAASTSLSLSSSSKGKGKEKDADEESQQESRKWGRGQTLAGSRNMLSSNTGGPLSGGYGRLASTMVTRGDQESESSGLQSSRTRSPTPDWGVDEDEIINYDSD